MPIDKDAKEAAEEELKQDGKFIRAQLNAARKYEEKAEEKAGTELRKAADHRTSAYQRLAAAKEKCKAAGISFKAFKEEYAPDLGRSTLYKVLAIGDGRVTIEEQQERDAKRQAAKRAKDEKVSVTPSDVTDNQEPSVTKPDVTDIPAAQEPFVTLDVTDIVPVRSLADRQNELSEQVTEACTGLADGEKTELLEFLRTTIAGLGLPASDLAAPLEAFKNTCETLLPAMSDDERRKARVYIGEWKPRRRKIFGLVA